MSRYSTIIIRFSLVGLFLWFGIMQLLNPGQWIGFVPVPLWDLIDPAILVRLNGTFEVVASLMLALGFLTRWVALALGAHLMGIALYVGGDIGVRDAALAMTSMAFLLSEPDAWTLDAKRKAVSGAVAK